MRFNFGSSPFKHNPPEGYRGYVEHVQAELDVVRAFKARLSSLPVRGLLTAHKAREEEEDEEGDVQLFSKTGLGLDDGLEESIYESTDLRGNAKNAHSRYFHGGDNFVGETKQLPRPPRSNLPSSIPGAGGEGAKEELRRQLVEVSRDLCVLYSRMAVLRTFHSVSVGPSVSPGTADEGEKEAGRLMYRLLLSRVPSDGQADTGEDGGREEGGRGR